MNRSIPSGTVRLALLALAFAVTLAAARPAQAQVIYRYQGSGFTTFSCDLSGLFGSGDCPTPSPTNPLTSYSTLDRVAITLTVTDPLPANATLFQNTLQLLPGFLITMTDGHQTLTFALGYDGADYADVESLFVSTDATGQITTWHLELGSTQTGGVIWSQHEVNQFGTFDLELAWLGGPVNYGYNVGPARGWTVTGAQTPREAVEDLIALLPTLGLSKSQLQSLTDKLNNVLASIDAGLNQQAINQLSAFINQVNAAVSNGKMAASTGQLLVDAADAIIAMLST
jgi:hypothetical protein